MYREYQPIVEPLDLVWRYDLKIFGNKWQDWIPYWLLQILLTGHRLN